jgi:hypothetical protein
MNAWPVRIIIVGATEVAALTFCRASAPGFVGDDDSSTAAPLNSTACVAPGAPPTIPNALDAARLEVAVALVTGAAAGRPNALDETFSPFVNVLVLSAKEESPVHPERAQATTTSKAVAFISDSVEVSIETPAESAVAH